MEKGTPRFARHRRVRPFLRQVRSRRTKRGHRVSRRRREYCRLYTRCGAGRDRADHATAGRDPFSRRTLWRILRAEQGAVSAPPAAVWGGATRAIVQAPCLRAELARVAPNVEITVLPNGLPAASFVAKSQYAAARPRLLFVGHLTYAKGFYDLMHVFRRLRAKWPELVLACAGELPRPNRAATQVLTPARQDDYSRRYREICEEIRDLHRRRPEQRHRVCGRRFGRREGQPVWILQTSSCCPPIRKDFRLRSSKRCSRDCQS